MGSRSRRALLVAFLAAPLAALGVCGSIASLAPAVAACEAPAGGDCCSRSGAPTCPRTPEPGRCVSCGAAVSALGEVRTVAAPSRAAGSAVRGDAAVSPRPFARTATALFDAALAAFPPRHLLLSTFRN